MTSIKHLTATHKPVYRVFSGKVLERTALGQLCGLSFASFPVNCIIDDIDKLSLELQFELFCKHLTELGEDAHVIDLPDKCKTCTDTCPAQGKSGKAIIIYELNDEIVIITTHRRIANALIPMADTLRDYYQTKKN